MLKYKLAFSLVCQGMSAPRKDHPPPVSSNPNFSRAYSVGPKESIISIPQLPQNIRDVFRLV